MEAIIEFFTHHFLEYTFEPRDLLVIGMLIIIEGLLSFDNAAVLATVVSRLPAHQQRKALLYGIWGAYIFRFIAVFTISFILQFSWLKFIAGAYLIYLCLRFFYEKAKKEEPGDQPKVKAYPGFWTTILLIEWLDINFSFDSIAAAVAFSDKVMIILIGALIGILAMRLVAGWFVTLIQRYPGLEYGAFIIVGFVGIKLVITGFFPSAAGNEYDWHLLSWEEWHHIRHDYFIEWISIAIPLFIFLGSFFYKPKPH